MIDEKIKNEFIEILKFCVNRTKKRIHKPAKEWDNRIESDSFIISFDSCWSSHCFEYGGNCNCINHPPKSFEILIKSPRIIKILYWDGSLNWSEYAVEKGFNNLIEDDKNEC